MSLALTISDWLLPRSPLHLRACWLSAMRIEIHFKTLQNNPSRLPLIFANDEEGAEYRQLCVMRLCATPLVETLL